MKINPKYILKDYEGKDLVGEDNSPITVSTVLIRALNASQEGTTAEQSIRAYEISLELIKKDEVEILSEDIVLIKSRMLKLFTPLIFGQVVNILEQKEVENSKK